MKPKRKKEPEYQRLLAQETLILEATERVVALLEDQGVSRQELAERLGKSKGFVSQILCGDRNMTLRTLGDLGYVLGHTFRMTPETLRTAGVEPNSADDKSDHGSSVIQNSSVSTDTAALHDETDSHEYALAA